MFQFSRLAFLAALAPLSLPAPLVGQIGIYRHVGKPAASYTRAFVGGADFDGDGYADYLAGIGGGSGGQLAVYSGATAQPLRIHRNHAVDDGLGTCVAVLGDIDGDGAPDYIAGAPDDDRNGVGAGAAHVFSGRTHARLASYYGSAAGDALGSCAALGDVDGDGVTDFAFAAPGHDFAAFDAGALYVLSGRTRLVVRSHFGGVGQQVGRLIVALGDVDRDGAPDYAASLQTSTGRALDVFSGRTGLRLVTFSLPLGAQPESVAPTGDLDGDGQPDLVAVAPAFASGAGVVFALSGRSLGVLQQVVGISASAAGDVDGDGRADFAVAETGGGTSLPRVVVYSGRTQTVLWSLGFSTTDHLAVAPTGDVNRDGPPDLLVRVRTPGVSHLNVISRGPVFFTTGNFEFDLARGGTTNMTTHAPNLPGRSYVVLGSASGTNPGTNIGGSHLPLNFDGLLGHTLRNPNVFPYTRSLGVLQSNGVATTTLTLPPGLPVALAGQTLQHAVLVLDGTTLHASSSAPLTLLGPDDRVGVVEETFANSARQDPLRSASGAFGRLTRVGGSGVHGDFDHRLGTDLGAGVYEFDLERDTRGGVRGFAIPATHTLSGREEFVVDGVFQFATVQVPAGVTVRVTGTKPLRLLVRGQCQLDGVLDVSAVEPLPLHLGFILMGQAPVRPGAGGGRGGRGADASTGSGVPSNGANGQDVQVAASHAYAGSAVGTGGRGSAQFPSSNATVVHNYSGVVCTQLAAGGAGGGNGAVGAPGNVLRTPNNVPGDAGPPSVAGTAFQLFPLPAQYAAFEHFAVGGAGGGGGGSNIYAHTIGRNFQWRSGAAGGGGGGVLALRAGGALGGAAGGEILARGGTAFRGYQSVVQGPPAPGGGGAGGSILLQSPARIDLRGRADVSGGLGGFIAPGTGQPLLDLSAEGGDGGAGFIRLESPIAPTIATAVPPLAAPNIGPLLDVDAQAGQQSTWYSTGMALTPRYLRYEIEADVNSVPMRFSDDPAFGQVALFGDPGVRVWFKLQGAEVGAGLQPAPGTVRAWRDRAADLTGDRATGFRFVILGNGQTVVVRAVRVVFEQ